VDKTNYLSSVSNAADQLARLGYLWQPPLGEGSSNGKEAKLLAYTPVARRNGFQSQLYQAAWEWGFAPIPVLDPHALVGIPWPGRMICHFHWLSWITDQATDERDAEAKVGTFENLLHALKNQ